MIPSIVMHQKQLNSHLFTRLNGQTALFQTIQFSMSFVSTQFKCQIHFYTYKQFYFKQFSLTLVQFKYDFYSTHTSLSQSGPGSDGNEGVLRIPQSSSITGASPSDGLMLYLGHSLVEGSYPPAEIQSSRTSLSQSGPWSDGNEGVLRIPQCSSITGASPSDGLIFILRFIFINNQNKLIENILN